MPSFEDAVNRQFARERDEQAAAHNAATTRRQQVVAAVSTVARLLADCANYLNGKVDPQRVEIPGDKWWPTRTPAGYVLAQWYSEPRHGRPPTCLGVVKLLPDGRLWTKRYKHSANYIPVSVDSLGHGIPIGHAGVLVVHEDGLPCMRTVSPGYWGDTYTPLEDWLSRTAVRLIAASRKP